MKIETEYSMGDAAFVMHNNRAVPIKIMGVYYSLDVYKGEHITYASDIAVAGGPIRFEEKYVFKTNCLGKRNKCGNFKWKYENEN